MNYCRSRKVKAEEEEGKYTLWELDNDLEISPPLGLFEEYLEIGKS